MPNRKIDDDRWFWPLMVVLLHATIRAGRDGLIAIFHRSFASLD